MKKAPFKMKGPKGLPNLPKPTKAQAKKSKGTLRAVSKFEQDFPGAKRYVDRVKRTYSPKQNVKRLKNLGKVAKKAVNYFRAT